MPPSHRYSLQTLSLLSHRPPSSRLFSTPFFSPSPIPFSSQRPTGAPVQGALSLRHHHPVQEQHTRTTAAKNQPMSAPTPPAMGPLALPCRHLAVRPSTSSRPEAAPRVIASSPSSTGRSGSSSTPSLNSAVASRAGAFGGGGVELCGRRRGGTGGVDWLRGGGYNGGAQRGGASSQPQAGVQAAGDKQTSSCRRSDPRDPCPQATGVRPPPGIWLLHALQPTLRPVPPPSPLSRLHA